MGKKLINLAIRFLCNGISSTMEYVATYIRKVFQNYNEKFKYAKKQFVEKL